jgi:D-alanyl-D-alanine carboxypeptidase/glycopeptide antibiotics resistance protein
MDSWIRFALTEIYAVLLLAFVFRRQLREKKKNAWLKILLVMLAMYLAQLFYVLLSPTYFFRRFAFSAERLNLVPFRALREWLAHPFNFFGNIILFLPVGFFEVLLHPGFPRKRQILRSVAVSAGLSLILEFAQFFNYRVPDIDDIILDTIGGFIGCLLCILLQKTGFDRTRVGRVLLPRIPRSWRGHMHLARFCILLAVSLEVFLFTANYIATIPRPEIRENEAPRAAANLPFATAAPAVPVPVVTPDVVVTPEPVVPAVTETAVPSSAPLAYDTLNLALEARNVLLVRLSPDGGSAEIIYAVGSNELIYPASTIKLLTALTVLDIAKPEEKVRLGTEIYIPPLDASRAGLEYGMTLTVRDLLEGLLLPSGADAAYALGVYCGRKLENNSQLSYNESVASFIAAMNRKAEALGAWNTTVKNVVGLDDSAQRTTAEDILRIAKVFLDQPVLAEICGLAESRIASEEGKIVSLSNTNKMLHPESVYFNGRIKGVKTGTTSRAGNCLVSVFTVGDYRYLCVVMHSSYDGKFRDTQALYDVCAEAK